MSVPVNHHYVSECHLKEFFNHEEKKIYLFDKELSNFYSKPGTGRIFSEDNLNTRLLNGLLDKESLENELRKLFEDNFQKHLQSVKGIYIDNEITADSLEDLYYLSLMALVGEYRNPKYKHGLDQTINNFTNHAINLGATVPEVTTHSDAKYQNTKGYIDVASLMLSKMYPLAFALISIKSDDHFLIPDTTGFLVRANKDTGEVMQFGLPISDKLFILGRSVSMGKYATTVEEIHENDSDLVFAINSDLGNYAYKTVACRDEAFLKKTIIKIGKEAPKDQYFYETTIGSLPGKKKKRKA